MWNNLLQAESQLEEFVIAFLSDKYAVLHKTKNNLEKEQNTQNTRVECIPHIALVIMCVLTHFEVALSFLQLLDTFLFNCRGDAESKLNSKQVYNITCWQISHTNYRQ